VECPEIEADSLSAMLDWHAFCGNDAFIASVRQSGTLMKSPSGSQSHRKPSPKEPAFVHSLPFQAVRGLVCVLALSYLGSALFWLPPSTSYVLGPIAGIVAALSCRQWWMAGATAAAGVTLGSFLGSVYFSAISFRDYAATEYWIVGGMALVVGCAAAWLLAYREDTERWIAWLAVALIIVAAWQTGFYDTTIPTNGGSGPSAAEMYASTPTVSENISDPEMFILVVRRMQAGESYYQANGRTMVEVNATRPQNAWNLRDMTTLRMPTLFWFLAALPPTWQSWVVAILVLISAGIIAAWTIAARYVHPSLALVGTVVTALYLQGFTAMDLVNVEAWAGMLALVSVALALKALSVRKNPLVWAGAAAAVGLLATVTREIAVAYLLLGLASTLVHKYWRERRVWIPWAVAIGVAVIFYVVHLSVGMSVAARLPNLGANVPGGGAGGHIDFSGAGLPAALRLLGIWTWWPPAEVWIVWLLGVIGGVVGPRDWPRRVLLAGATLGGSLALLLLHPHGVLVDGLPPGYWGELVLPTLLACSALAFARIAGLKPTGTSS